MAEVKNAFLKSKMNKDLDSRLVPSGEYRDAVNVQVIKSEGQDVGALENVQGNTIVATFDNLYGVDFVSVGYFADQNTSRIYVFLTTNTTGTSTAYNPNSFNVIGMWDSKTSGGGIDTSPPLYVLVQGAFLNFHEDFPIIGVNVLENLLFFTDNRNQPRKINIQEAINSSSYYQTEDQISVAKYNPYEPIEVWSVPELVGEPDTRALVINPNTGTPYEVTVANSVTNENKVLLTGPAPADLDTNLNGVVAIQTLNPTNFEILDRAVLTKVIPGNPVTDPATLQFNKPVTVSAGDVLVFFKIETSMYDVVSEKLPDQTTDNPYRETNFAGDPQFLEDKFVRFSYRFKFEDGEYSILAPFTQACFIPKQDGYFIIDFSKAKHDEKQTYSSTVVEFAENKVNKIDLHIPLPSVGGTLENDFKISELDILYKESDALAVQVVETIPVSRIADPTVSQNSKYFTFTYLSTKPYKTLPESELVRVYDKVPVKAFSQEVASNRIIYGNFQDKHTPPQGIDYQVLANEKTEITSLSSNLGAVEYPTSNVKENRNYQVGIVLSDKFGRQSTVILSNNTSSAASATGFGADTAYLPYRDDSTGSSAWDWLGSSLKVQFNSVIPNFKNEQTGAPGLYNGDPTSTNYNPLGWYSYKIVVKQVEQDYYNVYCPGAMKDVPFDYATDAPPDVGAEKEPDTSFISLINDNINKVPRDLTQVGPQDKTFRSSVKLFGRVMNTVITNLEFAITNEQFSQANFGSPGRTVFTTNAIEDLFDLFDVLQFNISPSTGQATPITDSTNPFSSFYKSDSNPFIAEFVTSQDPDFQFGVFNTRDNTSSEYSSINNLAVLETAPTVSRLDIFWETSSAGLISDLNTAISEGTTGAVGIVDFDFEAFEDAMPNNSANPTELINNGTNTFYFVDASGSQVVPISVNMIVKDNTGTFLNGDPQNPGVSKFKLIDDGAGNFKLRLDDDEYLYYEGPLLQNKNPRNIYNFSFFVNVSGITNELFPDVGVVTELQNVAPSIIVPSQNFISYYASSIIDLFDNENGSSDPTQNRKNLTFTISNVVVPTGQQDPVPNNPNYGLSIQTYSQTPNNGEVTVVQPLKGAVISEPNFGYITYDVTVTDEGGMSSTETITTTIGIPNMVDYFQNVGRAIEMASGGVDFFVDSLTNLNSTAVIPSSFQQGYTTSGLTYSNEVSGLVCAAGDNNDARYYARASQAKPITAPSSTFYVHFLIQMTEENESGGTYAAIEYRDIGSSTWSVATDVFGNPCVFDNEYRFFKDANGNTVLAGMYAENDGGIYENQIYKSIVDFSQGGSAFLSQPCARIFVLNDTGEYRIASGNVYNSYKAFNAIGTPPNRTGSPVCSDTPEFSTNVEYKIGDFANVPLIDNTLRGSYPIGQQSNIYAYEITVWAQGTPTCGTGTFQPTGVVFYSASPSARYLFTPNNTGGVAGAYGAIFNLWDNTNLTGKFELSTNVPQNGTIANPYYTRVRRADGNNPEQTRDGTYLLVYPDPNGDPAILGPCLDTQQSNSGSSSDDGTGTGTGPGGDDSGDLPDLDGPPDRLMV
jgi:hypothetical protein